MRDVRRATKLHSRIRIPKNFASVPSTNRVAGPPNRHGVNALRPRRPAAPRAPRPHCATTRWGYRGDSEPRRRPPPQERAFASPHHLHVIPQQRLQRPIALHPRNNPQRRRQPVPQSLHQRPTRTQNQRRLRRINATPQLRQHRRHIRRLVLRRNPKPRDPQPRHTLQVKRRGHRQRPVSIHPTHPRSPPKVPEVPHRPQRRRGRHRRRRPLPDPVRQPLCHVQRRRHQRHQSLSIPLRPHRTRQSVRNEGSRTLTPPPA